MQFSLVLLLRCSGIPWLPSPRWGTHALPHLTASKQGRNCAQQVCYSSATCENWSSKSDLFGRGKNSVTTCALWLCQTQARWEKLQVGQWKLQQVTSHQRCYINFQLHIYCKAAICQIQSLAATLKLPFSIQSVKIRWIYQKKRVFYCCLKRAVSYSSFWINFPSRIMNLQM